MAVRRFPNAGSLSTITASTGSTLFKAPFEGGGDARFSSVIASGNYF